MYLEPIQSQLACNQDSEQTALVMDDLEIRSLEDGRDIASDVGGEEVRDYVQHPARKRRTTSREFVEDRDAASAFQHARRFPRGRARIRNDGFREHYLTRVWPNTVILAQAP